MNFKFLLPSLLLLALTVFSEVHTEEIPVAYSSFQESDYPEPLGDFTSLRLPLVRAGNLLLIEAQVDTVRGLFILDTGAPGLILNSYYFWDYSVDFEQVSSDISGEREIVKTTSVRRFSVEDLYYENLTAHLTDLSAVERLRGVRIMGAIGLELLMHLELEVNVSELQLNFYKLTADGARVDGSSLVSPVHYIIPFEVRKRIINLPAEIGGYGLNLSFDTGAEALVLDNKLNPGIYALVQLSKFTRITGASGSSIPVHIGKLPAIEVGCPLKNVNVVITDLRGLERSYGEFIDGIIGYDLLARGVVSVNFVRQKIHLSWGSEN